MRIICFPITQVLLLLLIFFVTQFSYSADYQEKGMIRLPPKKDISVFKKEDRVAVIVGISQYHSSSGFRSLNYAVEDAKALAKEFERQGYVVKLLTNNKAQKYFILNEIKKAGELLKSSKKEKQGTLVFAFTGHGFADKNNNNYLAVNGTSFDYLSDSGLSLAQVRKQLRDSGARRSMMFIDACRDNPIQGKSVSNLGFSDLEDSQGLNILYSTAQGEVSYESPLLSHGVFTHFLLKGLKGQDEEAQKKGVIVFDDLAVFVSKKVKKWSYKNLPNTQTPYRTGESSGQFIIGFTSNKKLNRNYLDERKVSNGFELTIFFILYFIVGMFFSGALKVIYFIALPLLLLFFKINESVHFLNINYYSTSIYIGICLALFLILMFFLSFKKSKINIAVERIVKTSTHEAKLKEKILSGEEGRVEFLSNGMIYRKLARNDSSQDYSKGKKVTVYSDSNGNFIIN